MIMMIICLFSMFIQSLKLKNLTPKSGGISSSSLAFYYGWKGVGSLTGLLGYDFVVYFQYIGEQDHVLEFILYTTFTIQLLVPTVLLFVTRTWWLWLAWP